MEAPDLQDIANLRNAAAERMQDIESLRNAAAEYADTRVVDHCNHILAGAGGSKDWAAVTAILAKGIHKYNGK